MVGKLNVLLYPNMGVVQQGNAVLLRPDSQRDCQFTGTIGQAGNASCGAFPSLAHHLNPLGWFHPTNQHPLPLARFPGDNVEAMVNAINEINIGMATLQKHRLVARGFSTVAVACSIHFTNVGFGFNYSATGSDSTNQRHQPMPQNFASNNACVAPEKSAGEQGEWSEIGRHRSSKVEF